MSLTTMLRPTDVQPAGQASPTSSHPGIPASTTADPTPRTTLDDYLGPGERRFFGAGYRRADQRLRDIEVAVAGGGRGAVRARASVAYPTDWSRKGSTNQAPHLSSIDALLLAGEVAEVYLTHALGLDVAQRSDMRLRKVFIRAGSKPVEGTLADIPIEATISRPGTHSDPARAISTVDCLVGAMRVRCDIDHPAADERRESGAYGTADHLLGPADRRPFATAHRGKSQHVTGIRLDPRRSWATADCTALIPDTPVVGLESASHRTVSIIDAFVVAIQLGQILLYELDSMDRADSNTLWMRHTLLEIGDPDTSADTLAGPSPVTAVLEDPDLLVAADGDIWRTAVIAAACEHMRIRCSVTHRLPSSTARTSH